MISKHHQELKYFESSVVIDHNDNDNSSSRDTGSTTKKARGLAAAPCLLPEGVERALCMGRAWSLYDFMRDTALVMKLSLAPLCSWSVAQGGGPATSAGRGPLAGSVQRV